MRRSLDDLSLNIGLLLCVVLPLIGILLLTLMIERVSAENKLAAENAVDEGTINAVVVRSWGGCNPTIVIWDNLNNNWPNYGTTPILIDDGNPNFCINPTFTYNDLVASGADVVIMSNPAGGAEQYSAEEIMALETYAQEGHNVIGTFLLFQYEVYDNRELGPMFGLSSSGEFTSTVVTPTYEYTEPFNPLFNNMAPNYVSGGFPFSQIPLDDLTWDSDDLAGARFVAKTADDASVITVFDTPTYSAIYIANMAEYDSGTIDERFFYNAITYKRPEMVFLPLVLK